MSNTRQLVENTAKIPVWYMQNHSEERLAALQGGVDGLGEHYSCVEGLEEYVKREGTIKNGLDADFSAVNWEVVYLIIRDWYRKDLWRKTPQSSVVCDYMGVKYEGGEYTAPDIEVTLQTFTRRSLTELCLITNVNEETLRGWFKSMKVLFHSILEFTADAK